MCTEKVAHSRVKVEENKRKAVFRNDDRREYEVTNIDGCLIKNERTCDKLVARCDDFSVLVELKGVGVDYACSQLFAAVEDRRVKPLLKSTTGFLVVCSKFPRFDTKVRKAKERAAKQYGSGFHVVCNQGEFDIARVAAIDGPA